MKQLFWCSFLVILILRFLDFFHFPYWWFIVPFAIIPAVVIIFRLSMHLFLYIRGTRRRSRTTKYYKLMEKYEKTGSEYWKIEAEKLY